MLASLPCTLVLEQLGQMRMTLGGERAHTELLGQGEGLPIIALRICRIAWLPVRSDHTEQTYTPCLMASLPLALGKGQALVSKV